MLLLCNNNETKFSLGPHFYVEFQELSHLPRDLYQAEKRTNVVKS